MKTVLAHRVRRNFLRTTNPFGLEDPPTWFLEQLAALDNDLVIFASTHQPCYRLCRYKKRTLDVHRAIDSWPDTYILVQFGLVPWKSVLPASLDMAWGRVLTEIPQYDQWQFKSGDAVADHLDRREAEAEHRARLQQTDDLNQLGSYTYGVAKRVAGAKVGLSDRQWAGYAQA
jgi:hypothetical protein